MLAAAAGIAVSLPSHAATVRQAPPVGIRGQPGPTAEGAKVNPHMLAPISGAVLGQPQTIPERHPDEAAFARLQAQANAQAAAQPNARAGDVDDRLQRLGPSSPPLTTMPQAVSSTRPTAASL